MPEPQMSRIAQAFVTIGRMIRELEEEIRMSNKWEKLVRVGPFEIYVRPGSRFLKFRQWLGRNK